MSTSLVFILYDNRSGSTYLSALLNRYKGVSVSLESSFVSHIIEYPQEVSQKTVGDLLSYLQQEVQFRELGLDMDALQDALETEGAALNRKRFIEVIIHQYFSRRDAGSECRVIKHPPYAYLSEVITLFPEVRFLQIVRDGRAVFNSKLKAHKLSGEKMAWNPLKAAWDWRAKLKKAEQVAGRTITIRYEDLVADPEKTLTYVLEKLNISPQGRALTKQQTDYFRSIGTAQKGLHENVSKSPQKDSIDKWKQELGSKFINLYNYVNRRCLETYGYAIEQPIPTSTIILYVGYLLAFMSVKLKNVLLLLGQPSLLKLKIYRNYALFKD